MEAYGKTVVFFSLMRRGVTILQLARMHRVSVLTIKKFLERAVQENKVMEEGGEYWLHETENRKSCVAREAVKKRFEFAVELARYNPFITGIALANSWTFDASKKSSDVDVVIVCKKNRLYVARLLFVLPLKILQLRPNETERTPICASYFIDETEQLAQAMMSPQDVYFVYWVCNLYCVGNEVGWDAVLTDMRKKMAPYELHTPKVEREWGYHLRHRIVQRVTKLWADYNIVEKCARKIQQWYLPQSLRIPSAGVWISPTVFKAHTDDKREELITKFEELCQKHNNASWFTGRQ